MTQRKGKKFEGETAALAGKYGKRVPHSGAIGTITGIGRLAGDAVWLLPWLDDNIIALECKHGYSDKGEERKSLRLKRDWFDKHLAQAQAMNFYPAFAMKFKFTAENGISKFVLIPFPVMEKILKHMDDTYLELEELKKDYKKLQGENSRLKKKVAGNK